MWRIFTQSQIGLKSIYTQIFIHRFSEHFKDFSGDLWLKTYCKMIDKHINSDSTGANTNTFKECDACTGHITKQAVCVRIHFDSFCYCLDGFEAIIPDNPYILLENLFGWLWKF